MQLWFNGGDMLLTLAKNCCTDVSNWLETVEREQKLVVNQIEKAFVP